MTNEEHAARHRELHSSLDELFADFILHTGKGVTATVHDLVKWSHEQTIFPCDGENFGHVCKKAGAA